MSIDLASVLNSGAIRFFRSFPAESINALVNLGYKTKDAKNILDKIESDGLSVEELIRQALKSLNK